MESESTVADASEQPIVMELAVFCDPDSVRFALNEPFVQKGFIYATDGRVAACVPTNAPDTPPTAGRLPKMDGLIDMQAECDQVWNMKNLGCGECGGTGTTTTTKCPDCKDGSCSECSGCGTTTCHACDHEHDCEECEGTGSCDTCNGDCEVERYECGCVQCEKSMVQIGDAKLMVTVARKIDSLRNVRYTVVEDGKFRKLCFTADGGIRGLAMLSI